MRWAIGALALGMVVAAAWGLLTVYWSWNQIERISFDPAAARLELDRTIPPTSQPAEGEPASEVAPPVSPTSTVVAPEPDTVGQAPDAADAVTEGEGTITGAAAPREIEQVDTSRRDPHPLTILLVGNDFREKKGTSSADLIALFQVGTDTSDPVLLSIPRDLQISSPCDGTDAKLAAMLEGCGPAANGPELLAVVVEDLAGVTIDHFVMFGLDGFREVIDRLGGVEICVEHAVRVTTPARVLLEPGCSMASGRTAEAWIRARVPQELIGETWQPIEPSGDAARNLRQQDLLVELLGRLKTLSSPAELRGLVDDVADLMALDDNLSLAGAVDLAWEVRRTDPSSIHRPTLAVSGGVSADGAYIVTLDESIADVLAGTG